VTAAAAAVLCRSKYMMFFFKHICNVLSSVCIDGVLGSLYRHSTAVTNKELNHAVLPHTESK